MTNKSIIFLILFIFSNILHAESLLKIISEEGGSVGNSINTTFTTQTGSFFIDPNTDSGVIANYSGNGESWTLNFIPPNQASITVGYYGNAKKFASSTEPSLDVNGIACDEISGYFEVLEAEYNNGELVKFAVDFEQHCDGGSALYGQLRFNSDVSITSDIIEVEPDIYTFDKIVDEYNPNFKIPGSSLMLRNDGVLFQFGGNNFEPLTLTIAYPE